MRNLFYVMFGVMVFSAAAAVATSLPHAQAWSAAGSQPVAATEVRGPGTPAATR